MTEKCCQNKVHRLTKTEPSFFLNEVVWTCLQYAHYLGPISTSSIYSLEPIHTLLDLVCTLYVTRELFAQYFLKTNLTKKKLYGTQIDVSKWCRVAMHTAQAYRACNVSTGLQGLQCQDRPTGLAMLWCNDFSTHTVNSKSWHKGFYTYRAYNVTTQRFLNIQGLQCHNAKDSTDTGPAMSWRKGFYTYGAYNVTTQRFLHIQGLQCHDAKVSTHTGSAMLWRKGFYTYRVCNVTTQRFYTYRVYNVMTQRFLHIQGLQCYDASMSDSAISIQVQISIAVVHVITQASY